MNSEVIDKPIQIINSENIEKSTEFVYRSSDEMKDSGVEWIGLIPKDWITGKFKKVINILTDYTSNGSFASLAENVTYLDEGYSRVIRLTDLRENMNNQGIYISEQSHKFLKKSELFGE
ncbi:MAG: hypothetical protein ACK4IX_11325, partial [Candidatus Sericytochromatia bacterium]